MVVLDCPTDYAEWVHEFIVEYNLLAAEMNRPQLEVHHLINSVFGSAAQFPFDFEIPGNWPEYVGESLLGMFHLARAKLAEVLYLLRVQKDFKPIAIGAELDAPNETLCIWLGDPQASSAGDYRLFLEIP